MSITYRRKDERPPWEGTVETNGMLENLSVGFTFKVLIAVDAETAPIVEKTAGIYGFEGGVFQVNWVPDELDLDPGEYEVQCIAKRSSDDFEWSVADKLIIKPRLDTIT